MLDMQQKHIKELQVRDTEHKKEVSRLTALLNKTLKWFPQIKGMLNLEKPEQTGTVRRSRLGHF